MNFSGSNTKGLGAAKQTLRGNNIYTVKFDGVEYKILSVKDALAVIE